MKRKLALIIVISGALGILLTLVNHVLDNPMTPVASGLGIYKYFTILSNLLVVIYFWVLFSSKSVKSVSFHKWLGGITVYITVTGLVFILFLQKEFFNIVIDQAGSILCHYIVPFLTIGFLIFFRKDYNFRFKDIFKWLIFPILYIIFVLIRSTITNDYIYPFLDLDRLGAGLFVIYILSFLVFFVILSVLNVLLTRQKK